MLRSLYIDNIAIISQLSVNFHDGMTCVTGETGAGKSIVIDALALALGSRADQNLITHNREKAEVSVEFDISNNSAAQSWLDKQELMLDEPLCILKRILYSNKPSKSLINNRPVSAGMLNEIGQLLVSICGQQEHLTLINPASRLAVIDQHANVTAELGSLKMLYRQMKQNKQQIHELQQIRSQAVEHDELLGFLIEELSQGKFSAADYKQLDENHKRLSHNSDIVCAVNASIELLESSMQQNIHDSLNRVLKLLAQACRFEPRLQNTLKTLEGASIACTEAASELNAISHQLEMNPDELLHVEQRLSRYHDMARKHRCEPAQLEEKLESLQQKLEVIENSDALLKSLADQQAQLTVEYNKIAQEISRARQRCAKSLSRTITAQLQQLNLEGARFDIECKTDTDVTHVNGQDTVRFLVSTNRDQPPGPIEKIASGGELSRISLAIALESGAAAGNAALVFDEVDTGVSGRTADVVGDKLKQLSKKNQTICITHLPQVACKADYQLRVAKRSDKKAQVKLDYLDTEERVIELARFLSGRKITEESLANARVMLMQS